MKKLFIIFILMCAGLHASAADYYEQQASAQRQLGASNTSAQRASADLVPIFKCSTSYLASGGDARKRKKCLELVSQFESRAGKSFEDSQYPVIGLKKMVAELKKEPLPKYKGDMQECIDAGGVDGKPGCRCPDGAFIRPDRGISCPKGETAGFEGYCKNSNGRFNGAACQCPTDGFYYNPYVERCASSTYPDTSSGGVR